jgi:hypothetical protein
LKPFRGAVVNQHSAGPIAVCGVADVNNPQFVEKPPGSAVRRWKTPRNANLLPSKLPGTSLCLGLRSRFALRASLRLFEIVPDDFILSASLRFALRASLRLFEIVPDDFILSASLRFALRASLRLFEIVPDDFIAVLCVARHPPARFPQIR